MQRPTGPDDNSYVPPPDSWDYVQPSAVGWDPKAVADVVRYAFDHNTDAFLMVVGGRIMVERYADSRSAAGSSVDAADGAHRRRDVASLQKSVVSLLVGRAAAEGLLDLNEPVSRHLGPGWTRERRETAITVANLLTMTSGLSRRLRTVAEPNVSWFYNTMAYQQLQPLLEAVTGSTIDDLANRWLWAPIGATHSAFVPRNVSDPNGRRLEGLVSSARDLARTGLVVQREGRWGQDQVLDIDYRATALSPSSAFNPSYGYLWWLNGHDGHRLPGPDPALRPGWLIPHGPADLVAALGKDDQKLYLSRAHDLVVVRTGRAALAGGDALSDFDDILWSKIMAARADQQNPSRAE